MATRTQSSKVARDCIDKALVKLLRDTRGFVRDCALDLNRQGVFSLDEIPHASRGNLQRVEDIGTTGNPTALLAVMLTIWDRAIDPWTKGENGVTYTLADKVRLIRNDWAHEFDQQF